MNSSPPKLICLCDGGFELGFGHVSRCLALAEAFEDLGWRAVFAGCLREGAADLVTAAGFDSVTESLATGESPELTVRMLRERAASAAVVDSYAAGRDYLRAIAAETAVLLVDDYARLDEYPCAAILHPAVAPDALIYPPGIPLLTGPGYAPFRRAFRKARRADRRVERIQRVLVTVGGGDRLGVTRRVVEALARYDPSLIVRAVIGRGYVGQERLQAAIRQLGPGSDLLVQVPSLAGEMAGADLCVCGGGMTKYEAAYLGVPCVTIPVSDDQVPEARVFERLGVARALDRADRLSDADLDADLRVWMPGLEGWRAQSGRALALFPQDPTLAAVEMFLRLPQFSCGEDSRA